MLITFSGLVGSGKSTAASHVLDTLRRAGISSRYVRFQALPYLTQRPSPARGRINSSVPPATRSERELHGVGYRRSRLTLARALVYATRALLFREFPFLSSSDTFLVVNRYFYDNLAHYRLTTRLERVYLAILKRLIRAPDLPFVLIASERSIAERRPQYSDAYVNELSAGYRNLLQYFPELIVVHTDVRASMEETVDNALCSAVLDSAVD